MPRSYFDALDGERPTADPRGRDLDGIHEAVTEAVKALGTRSGRDGEGAVVVWGDYHPLLRVTRSGVQLMP